MALSNAPQMQWSIDQTAGGILALSRGFIQAATSDNIQVLALRACESFGTTLPISTITRVKVEQLARRNRMHTLDFLKCQVGYKAGDSADVLSRSDGGIRFLCLAAILVSWDTNELLSAQLLELQIRENVGEGQPMPTLLQLKDLLAALRPKLLHSGFIDQYLGCKRVCIARGYDLVSDRPQTTDCADISPGVEGLSNLINALRRCFRVGELHEFVMIECWNAWIPWTMTVIKWLVESAPTINCPSNPGLDMPGHRKITVVSTETFGRFWVTVGKKLDSLSEIVSAGGASGGTSHGWYTWVTGSISPQQWFSTRLATQRLSPVFAMPLLKAALIKIPEKVLLSHAMARIAAKASAAGIKTSIPCAFPSVGVRLAFLAWISKDVQQECTESTSREGLLMQAAEGCTESTPLETLLAQAAEECNSDCGCIDRPKMNSTDDEGEEFGAGAMDQCSSECSNLQSQNAVQNVETLGTQSASLSSNDQHDSYSSDEYDSTEEQIPCLRNRMGQFVADVLSLVLFDVGSKFEFMPRLAYPDFRSNAFNFQIHDIAFEDVSTLQEGVLFSERWLSLVVFSWWPVLAKKVKFIVCRPNSIFRHAWNLTCYNQMSDRPGGFAIAASFGGQVIYPTLMEGRQPRHLNYLQLHCSPGVLSHEGNTISYVEDKNPSHFVVEQSQWTPRLATVTVKDIEIADISPSITKPAGLGPTIIDEKVNIQVYWGTSLTCLQSSLSHTMLEQRAGCSHAWDLVFGAAQSLSTLPCKHRKETPEAVLPELHEFGVVSSGLMGEKQLSRQKEKRYLVSLHGCPGIQHAQTAVVRTCCILHSQGCVICALKLAIALDVKLVIC